MYQKITIIILFIFSNFCFADDLISAAAQHTDSTPEYATEAAHEETVNPTWSEKAQEVLIQALSLTGIQYKYGGSSPDTGFDCSGFVRYVFSQGAKITLPPTARAISQIGKTVKKEDLQPGDLVFFNTLKSTFSHVGIYLGDNKFIHAPRTGKTVTVENMNSDYWMKRFNGAQRLETEMSQSK
ncbi:MAG: C40 family peptidase [Methylophilus sp.]|nr:C40 family peptidase [Methylophilus sp.]